MKQLRNSFRQLSILFPTLFQFLQQHLMLCTLYSSQLYVYSVHHGASGHIHPSDIPLPIDDWFQRAYFEPSHKLSVSWQVFPCIALFLASKYFVAFLDTLCYFLTLRSIRLPVLSTFLPTIHSTT